MKLHLLALALLLGGTSAGLGATAIQEARDISPEFVARDSQTAGTAAVEYFTSRSGDWAKKARPFRAAAVAFARSPISAGTLKKGEPIWVVVVVNDAESTILQVPVGIVWVRAKDGTVFITEPQKG